MKKMKYGRRIKGINPFFAVYEIYLLWINIFLITDSSYTYRVFPQNRNFRGLKNIF